MAGTENQILTISLREAATLLGYTTTRSVTKYCKKKNVPIFSEGGKGKYIIKQQLEQARLKNFIEYLKDKHNDKWMDAYQSYMNLNLPLFINPKSEEKINLNFKRKEYEPQSVRERQFLTTLLTKKSPGL